MPDFETLPPNLEVVEAENDRLRNTIERVERLLTLPPNQDVRSAADEAIRICRRVLNL